MSRDTESPVPSVGLIPSRRGPPRKRAEALRLGRVVLGRVDPADPLEVMGRVFRDLPGEGEVHLQDLHRVETVGETQLRISVLDLRIDAGAAAVAAAYDLPVDGARLGRFILGFMGVTAEILKAIADMGLTPLETMLIIIGFYLILGMFMETLSMMLTTVPIVFPIVAHLGYDPVWFGIMITVLMETALITPPIGVNLYVVHGIRTGGKFNDVAVGAAPFVIAMIGMVALLLIFPGLALWLPSLVY